MHSLCAISHAFYITYLTPVIAIMYGKVIDIYRMRSGTHSLRGAKNEFAQWSLWGQLVSLSMRWFFFHNWWTDVEVLHILLLLLLRTTLASRFSCPGSISTFFHLLGFTSIPCRRTLESWGEPELQVWTLGAGCRRRRGLPKNNTFPKLLKAPALGY